MIVELKAKSQLTIPNAIVKSMGLKQGDFFEISEEKGRIILTPVALYPKEYVAHLEAEAKTAKKRGKEYASVSAMMEDLEKD